MFWIGITGYLVEGLRISASIFLLIVGVFLFQYFLAVTQTPQKLAEWLAASRPVP